MSERVHLLAQSIFGKSSLDDCTLQETMDLAQRYPYFAPAQFLYLQKLKSANSEDYLKQLQKAVLYYHNPLAFEYFISSDRFLTEIDPEQQPAITSIEQQTTQQAEEVDVQSLPVEKSVVLDEASIKEDISKSLEQPVSLSEDQKDHVVEMIREDKKPEALETQTALQEPKNPNPKTEPEISFEPYHTVDYFASQGIKLSQEEVSKDKFGKQLKSFTDWLKTMKRLPANQVGQMDTTSEKKVSHLAEDSVHNSDVITEAMAEVWLKQGNREKAIETYNKLSLLNPSKRSYFATLIENLKRS